MKNSAKHKNLAKQLMASAEVDIKTDETNKTNGTVVNEGEKTEKVEVPAVETPQEGDKTEEIIVGTPAKKENKRQKKSEKMIDENKLSQLEAISGTDIPKQKVKIEKADKGLYERTENSTILLTEDNKMLLND